MRLRWSAPGAPRRDPRSRRPPAVALSRAARAAERAQGGAPRAVPGTATLRVRPAGGCDSRPAATRCPSSSARKRTPAPAGREDPRTAAWRPGSSVSPSARPRPRWTRSRARRSRSPPGPKATTSCRPAPAAWPGPLVAPAGARLRFVTSARHGAPSFRIEAENERGERSEVWRRRAGARGDGGPSRPAGRRAAVVASRRKRGWNARPGERGRGWPWPAPLRRRRPRRPSRRSWPRRARGSRRRTSSWWSWTRPGPGTSDVTGMRGARRPTSIASPPRGSSSIAPTPRPSSPDRRWLRCGPRSSPTSTTARCPTTSRCPPTSPPWPGSCPRPASPPPASWGTTWPAPRSGSIADSRSSTG